MDLHKIVAETVFLGYQQRRTWPSDSCTRSSSSPILLTGNSTLSAGTVDWKPAYPSVPVVAHVKMERQVSVRSRRHSCVNTLAKAGRISTVPVVIHASRYQPQSHRQAPGVGQVWVDTQFEMMNEKSKPGTATAVDATTFKVDQKSREHHGGIRRHEQSAQYVDR